MKPAVCSNCAGYQTQPFTTRKIVCLPCKGTGVTWTAGHDPWGRYRAHWGIAVTPARLALEEALDEQLPR